MKYIYLTNHPEVAKAITGYGVDWIMVDLEILGKNQRQFGRNTVISAHSISDIKKMRSVLKENNLLVRINPIGPHTNSEIDSVMAYRPDAVMLPFFTEKHEVERFVDLVRGRCKVFLLVETLGAIANIEDIIAVQGIDYIHIGLNDLHIERGTKFMFEFMSDGSMDELAKKIKIAKIPFGIGGVGKFNLLKPPAERILVEHFRLGSQGVILSRSFMDSSQAISIPRFLENFKLEFMKLKDFEKKIPGLSDREISINNELFKTDVITVRKLIEANEK